MHLGISILKKLKKKLSDLAKLKTGEKNPFYGKKHSEKTKIKLSKVRKGITPGNARKVKINGVIFKTIVDAAKHLNCSNATIIYRIKSKSEKYKDYYYEINNRVSPTNSMVFKC